MNTATLRRGEPRRTNSSSGPRARRPVQRTGWLTQLLGAIPVSADFITRLTTGLAVLVFALLLWLVAQFLGLPAMLGAELSNLGARVGLQVAKVEVRGLDRMDELPVYNLALPEVDHAMLAVDLAALRARIMTLGWVKEARVSRRLPDTLVIDIVERQPVAIWQRNGRLSLVDETGAVLSGVDARTMPDLPLVVGPQANVRTRDLARLMDAAPALRPMLAGATWVGNRRWDLRFKSNEILALPEGEAEAAAALLNFARMDGVDRLLGRGILRFDMRDPARFVARLPADPAQADAVAPALQHAAQSVRDAAAGNAKDAKPAPEADVDAESRATQAQEG
jgi:cell division protein FtsQ